MFCEEHGVDKSDITSICHSFRENVVSFEYETYSDAKTVLHYFKEKGYENYVISNNFPELGKVFEQLVLDTEISGYFLSASVVHNIVDGKVCCEQLMDLLKIITE